MAIAVILIALRRSTTASDELSKEWKKRFEAINPTLTSENKAAFEQKQAASPSAEKTQTNPSYLPVLAEIRETKGRLEQSLKDVTAPKEKEMMMLNEIQSLKIEINTLRERLIASGHEMQKLRTLIEEQNLRFQNQKRDFEIQRKEIKHATEQPKQVVVVAEHEQVSLERRLPRVFRNIFHRRSCLVCGRELRPEDQYCDSCGQPVTAIS